MSLCRSLYGGLLGPAQKRQRQDAAEVARYLEKPELLYLGAAPPGMEVSRAEVGPTYFSVDYRPSREGFEMGWVGLTVRPAIEPVIQCPDPQEKRVTCTVDAHGEVRTVRNLPGNVRGITLTRRHRSTQVEITSRTLDEPGLRHVLDSLHPLTEAELKKLTREQKISHRL